MLPERLRATLFFLFCIALPTALTPAAPTNAGESSPVLQKNAKGKRVYTNDDLPVSDVRPSAAPASDNASAAGKPVPVPAGEKIVPFVPSPMEVVDKMLEVAGVSASDTVYDMGSGDGRIVLRAAEKYGARGVGVEIDHLLAVESAEKVKEMKLDKLVTIIEGDMFKVDLKPATVVAIYLVLSANNLLRPLLEKDLRPGARVVVHDSRIPGWEPASEQTVNIGPVPHAVYLYEIPGAFRKQSSR